MAKTDADFMRLALKAAVKARGRTSPNPMVGCVLVRGQTVIATGYHHRAGADHAEVDALKKAGKRARGATAYVTLEPCNHVGRTGKCSEALLRAGVARVVAGMADPNPRVEGGGAAALKKGGVAVTMGVCEAECREVNRAFVKWITTGRPWVTLKAAVTLDGRIATQTGDSRWISGERSRQEAHRLRAYSDAILVGGETVVKDDPELTTRLVKGRSPRRVILSGSLRLPLSSKAVPDAWIFTTQDDPKKTAQLTRRGAEVIQLGKRKRVDLGQLLDELGRRNIVTLLVEGGGRVHGQFLSAGLVDEVALFVAPRLIGQNGVPLLAVNGPAKMADGWQLTDVRHRVLGDDVLIAGRVKKT